MGHHVTSSPTVVLAVVGLAGGQSLKPLGMELILKAIVLGGSTWGKEEG